MYYCIIVRTASGGWNKWSEVGKNGWDFSDVVAEKWVKLGTVVGGKELEERRRECSVEMLLHLSSRVPVASHIRRKLRPANICLRASWEQRIITPYNTLLLASLFPQLNLYLHRNQIRSEKLKIVNLTMTLFDLYTEISAKYKVSYYVLQSGLIF